MDSTSRRGYYCIKRFYFIKIRKLSTQKTSILDEAKLVQFSKEPFPQVTNNNNNVLPTNKLPIDGPFTLVTTKDRLYKEAVGGPGYPR